MEEICATFYGEYLISNKVPSQTVAARFLPTTVHIFPKFVTKVATTIHHLASQIQQCLISGLRKMMEKWMLKSLLQIFHVHPLCLFEEKLQKVPITFLVQQKHHQLPSVCPLPEKEALLGPLRAAGNLMTGQEILLMS